MLVIHINIDVLIVAVFDHVPGQKVSLFFIKLEWIILQCVYRLFHGDVLLLPVLLGILWGIRGLA